MSVINQISSLELKQFFSSVSNNLKSFYWSDFGRGSNIYGAKLIYSSDLKIEISIDKQHSPNAAYITYINQDEIKSKSMYLMDDQDAIDLESIVFNVFGHVGRVNQEENINLLTDNVKILIDSIFAKYD